MKPLLLCCGKVQGRKTWKIFVVLVCTSSFLLDFSLTAQKKYKHTAKYTQEKYSTEPLRVTAVWLERTKVAGLKQFNRGYFSHSYVNATGAVSFELTNLETESIQTFQTAYTLADFADSLSKELNGTRYCNAHRRFLFGHLPLTQFQMEKAGLASTPAELKKFTWDHYGTGTAALPITETGTYLKVDIQISGLGLSSTADTVITVTKAGWDDTERLWIQTVSNRSKHSTENAED